MKKWLLIGALAVLPAVAAAEEDGTLNPEEMTFAAIAKKLNEGKVDMISCANAYYVHKGGKHTMAKPLFEKCAEAGFTRSMTFMAQLEDNGLGGPENAEAAAAWDKRAADAGDPVGKLNYGLDLMRGRGVAQDIELGKTYVDEAAAAGIDDAIRLQNADYDLDEVTPDADNWKYDLLY